MADRALVDAIPTPRDDCHTLTLPLRPNEQPNAKEVAAIMVKYYGHLLFAESRLARATHELIDDKDGRRLLVRFPRWAGDHVDTHTPDEYRREQDYIRAKRSKGAL